MIEDNEVRRQVAKSPEESMRDFIDGDIDEEENYIYTGIVVDNNDPDRQGKCKIRVYSIFGEDVPDESLPWALPDFSFIGSTVGNFIVPPIGTIVNTYFDKGDIYLPHFFSKAVQKSKQPKRRMKNYPSNIVFWETDNGDYMELDRNSSTFTFHQKSGTQITIYSNGNTEIDCRGKIFAIKNADTCEIFGTKSTNLGGNMGVLYSSMGTIPTDAEGRPIQGLAVSQKVTVGG